MYGRFRYWVSRSSRLCCMFPRGSPLPATAMARNDPLHTTNRESAGRRRKRAKVCPKRIDDHEGDKLFGN